MVFLTQINRRYYLWPDEELPVRKCNSKRHIVKVMFLTAVARPRWDFKRHRMWNGKIGTWPFIEHTVAQRRSKNRDNGAPVTKPMNVTKKVYRQYLIDKVIPAIKSQWPGQHRHTIYLQQDNAKPHVAVSDSAVCSAGREDGWDIKLTAQPAMSPDFNVLDLGFFNAIQSLQHRSLTQTIDELVVAVHKAFNELEWRVLDKTFMTLQKVMEESLKQNGNNAYLLPHIKKDKFAREGSFVLSPACDPDASAAFSAMLDRIDYERRIEILSDLFDAGCTVELTSKSTPVDDLCDLVDDMETSDDDEDMYHIM
ncbi:Aste57867_25506 [Aphanomyces stellatus]|uniref:Aste57867_25506 protein n=1 Tax=Aphanomyces stellatus TaxID=120398 RepID=A0A485LTZ5_9STRA|nr:hypothetical protein As57867_025427 [Aphanomyces stellatus]VFU02129.1 Aste57867_25506 [Aphanomyces stellatus]